MTIRMTADEQAEFSSPPCTLRRSIAMKVLIGESSREQHRTDIARRDVPWLGLRVLTAGAVATAIVGLGVLPVPARPARAGDEGRGGPSASQTSRQDFIREIRRTLKEQDDRLIALARQVLDEPDSPQSLADQLVGTRIMVAKAESDYLNARLDREVKEIAIREYTEGVFIQDRTAVEGEVALARSDLERARDLVDVAKGRQARIKEVADENTAYGRMLNYDFSDRIVLAMLEVDKRKLALEQAEAKKQSLLKFTQLARTKQLEADVKGAYSNELAKQATWELEKAKLARLQEGVKAPWPASSIGKRLLALLDRATPIEEQAHARLDQLTNATDADESLRKEIRDLATELGAIVEEAEAARAGSEFARLKSRLRRATRR